MNTMSLVNLTKVFGEQLKVKNIYYYKYIFVQQQRSTVFVLLSGKHYTVHFAFITSDDQSKVFNYVVSTAFHFPVRLSIQLTFFDMTAQQVKGILSHVLAGGLMILQNCATKHLISMQQSGDLFCDTVQSNHWPFSLPTTF